MAQEQRAKFILSTDTLTGYGLDLAFQVAKDINFDGLDLAMWKNFDSWNVSYVLKLIDKYALPINVIQVSSNINRRELDLAIDLAINVGASVITINPPLIYKYNTYKFIFDNIGNYRRHNKRIKFAIINPPKSTLFVLPIPKYYFSNIVEIIKKYKMHLGFDVSNIEEAVLETRFLRRMSNFVPYIPVVYISDKDKLGKSHQPLGSGVLKLPSILKKFKQNEFYGYFSLKLDIEKKDLADLEKVEMILKKCRLYYKDNFEDMIIK